MFLARIPAGNAQSLELRFCPPPLNGADGKPLATPPVPLPAAVFLLTPWRRRRVVPLAALGSFSGEPKKVRTSSTGTFTIRTRISSTTFFIVDVAGTCGPCLGSSAAPRGCPSETVLGTSEKTVRVVPRA